MFNNSDSDITTYSQDERIAKYLAEQKTIYEEEAKKKDEERKIIFEQYFEQSKDIKHSVFQLEGLSFIRFRHTKIKFTFEPHKIVWTNRDIIFYCSLYYRHGYWHLRRSTFPNDSKVTIYKLLEGGHRYAFIDDENVVYFIRDLYKILSDWSVDHEQFRRRRYRQYQEGADIILYPEEETLFLTEEEIEELHHKRDAILRRMLPP